MNLDSYAPPDPTEQYEQYEEARDEYITEHRLSLLSYVLGTSGNDATIAVMSLSDTVFNWRDDILDCPLVDETTIVDWLYCEGMPHLASFEDFAADPNNHR